VDKFLKLIVGTVVVWNPVTDRVSIERLGSGSPLPSGPVWPVISGTVSVAPMVLPERITVVGAPVRFQPRLCFRPVGRDWDDGYYPWTEVTYIPTNGTIDDPWQRSMPPSYPNVTPTARLNYFQARALASESILRDFQLWCADPANTADKRIPVPGLNRFLSPASTDSDGVTRVDNRFRIILQNTRPEQVVPRPGDENRIDPQTGQPFAAEFYNGYAKDRPPVSFGSIAVGAAGTRQFGFWGNRATIDAHGNTPAKSAFYVPFSIIDPLRQIIRYSAHIFRLVRTNVSDKSTARLKPPGEPLVVETGCLVLHPDTYAPVCYQYDLVLGRAGGTGGLRRVLLVMLGRELAPRHHPEVIAGDGFGVDGAPLRGDGDPFGVGLAPVLGPVLGRRNQSSTRITRSDRAQVRRSYPHECSGERNLDRKQCCHRRASRKW
jgi:hypothetical protein